MGFKSLFPLFLHANLFLFSFAFKSPFDKSLSLPYGRQLRAVLSGKVPLLDEDVPDNLQWWHSIRNNTNNTIDCRCGEWTESEETDIWADEGLKRVTEYPWSVSIVSPGMSYAYCGGSLVNDRYVLTAASCVDGSVSSGVEVLIGSWPKAHLLKRKIKNEEEGDEGKLNDKFLFRKKVHRVIIHPKYSDKHLDYNIALLRLQGPVPTFGNKGGVGPVCLPTESDSFYEGRNASSLFWRFKDYDGILAPEKRSELQSVIIDRGECKKYDYSTEWSNMPDSLMCTKMEEPPKGNSSSNLHTLYDCPGDAGGPLLVSIGEKKIQVGVDSWTACYGRPKGVGVFTRINEFLPWIKLHISEDGRVCAY